MEYTDEFEEWWDALGEDEQDSVAAVVRLLELHGPHLGFPRTSEVKRSRHPHLRELRIQHDGRPFRVLYAFDPRRTAILLIGGDKTGNERWYEIHVPIADHPYDDHLRELSEGKPDDG